MKDNRSQLQIKIAAVKRLSMWHFLSNRLNLLLVTEFPKSGASWFCQMLSDSSGIPFPRNISPKFQQSIMHGHHLVHPRMGKCIAVLRDGRDIMVSAYFHFLFENDRNVSRGVAHHRDQLRFKDYHFVKENMPEFIQYMFSGYAKRNRFHFSWSEFVENISERHNQVCVIKYEELLTRPVNCLERALKFYDLNTPRPDELQDIVERYSFKRVAKRAPGVENNQSFIRKGIKGDWKNYFNSEAIDLFKKYAGEALIVAGYEESLDWGNEEQGTL